MDETLQAVLVALLVAVVLVAGLRLALRSHRLSREYRAATPSQRKELEARMAGDPQLAAHMRPVGWRDVWFGLLLAALLLVLHTCGLW
jgi:hypothetical protein